MKTINASVHIQCRQISDGIVFEVADNATAKEIEEQVAKLAMDGIGFDRIVHYPEIYCDVEYDVVDDDGEIISD